jgi:hypothetical protein
VADIPEQTSPAPVPDRNEEGSRTAYILKVIGIFVGIPIVANIVGHYVGFDFSGLSGGWRSTASGHPVYSIGLNPLSVWYIQIPLFIRATYLRVLDAGMNKWLTLLFILPVINLLIWFWPPKRSAV